MSQDSLSFFQHFRRLRVAGSTGRSPYRVADLVFVALCATIAGADTWVLIEAFAAERREWLARFCELPLDDDGRPRTPSHDTLERLFARLDPDAFGRCFGSWTAALAASLGLGRVAIDGKCLRGSGDKSKGLRPLHLVSAWSAGSQISLAQVAVDEKSNEIAAIPELLRLLDLNGALVTIDAIGTQKDIAARIIAQGGDYALPVKGNQAGLLADIAESFDMAGSVGGAFAKQDVFFAQERGHGRTERRKYVVMDDLSLIGDLPLWAGLAAIGLCVYERESEGETSREVHYFIGSRRMGAKGYAEALRGHWGIENRLHWQLDVSFREDGNQVANRNAAQNLATIRRLALGLLKRHPFKGSINTKRYKAALDIGFAEQVLQAGVPG